MEKRSYYDNVKILIKLIIEKTLKNENLIVAELVPLYSELSGEKNVVFYENSKIDEISTVLIDKILENKENLSLLELISLSQAVMNTSFWITNDPEKDDLEKVKIENLELLNKLINKNILGFSKILEYLLIEYKKYPPNMENWNKVILKEDLLNVSPSVLILLIEKDDNFVKYEEPYNFELYDANEDIDFVRVFREYYFKGKFKNDKIKKIH